MFILSIRAFMPGLWHKGYSLGVGEINRFSTQVRIGPVASPELPAQLFALSCCIISTSPLTFSDAIIC
jgi:hypothetical protein